MSKLRTIIAATAGTACLSLLGACGTASGTDSGTDPGAVAGRVTVEDSGEPYAGATVEFRNVYGKELHTVTDSDGYYSIPPPDGTYNTFALDLKDMNAGFKVVGSDSVVSVPTSEDVDFVAYPATEPPGVPLGPASPGTCAVQPRRANAS